MSDTLSYVKRDPYGNIIDNKLEQFYRKTILDNINDLLFVINNDDDENKNYLKKILQSDGTTVNKQCLYNFIYERLPTSSDSGFFESKRLINNAKLQINKLINNSIINCDNTSEQDIHYAKYTLDNMYDEWYKMMSKKIKDDIKYSSNQKTYITRVFLRIKKSIQRKICNLCDEILFKIFYNKSKQPSQLSRYISNKNLLIFNDYFRENNVITCPCCLRQEIDRNSTNREKKVEKAHIRPQKYGFKLSKYNVAPTCNKCNNSMKQLGDMLLYCCEMNKKINNGEEPGPYYGTGLKNLDKVPKYSKYHTEDLRKLNSIEKVTDLFNEPPNKRIRITR